MPVPDSHTAALLHFDGPDAGTTITDESGKTWTPVGNEQIDTAHCAFGEPGSMLFDGNGDYITRQITRIGNSTEAATPITGL